jgi:hypothetical protein
MLAVAKARSTIVIRPDELSSLSRISCILKSSPPLLTQWVDRVMAVDLCSPIGQKGPKRYLTCCVGGGLGAFLAHVALLEARLNEK